MLGSLTVRQSRFVEEYIIEPNATQAAIRAGYSVKTAAVIGHQNLRKINIQAVLQERRAVLAAKVAVTQERLIEEYARIGFADMASYATWGPNGVTLRDIDQLPQGASVAVAEVSEHITETGRTIRFKLHDKKGALDSLAKHLGMFPQPPAIQVDNSDRRTLTFKVVYDDDGIQGVAPAPAFEAAGLDTPPSEEEDSPGGSAFGENH